MKAILMIIMTLMSSLMTQAAEVTDQARKKNILEAAYYGITAKALYSKPQSSKSNGGNDPCGMNPEYLIDDEFSELTRVYIQEEAQTVVRIDTMNSLHENAARTRLELILDNSQQKVELLVISVQEKARVNKGSITDPEFVTDYRTTSSFSCYSR